MDGGKPFVSDRRQVRSKPIGGDALRRAALLLEQLAQKPPRRFGGSAGLDEEIEDFAFVVESAP